jgi:hypothetical protein
MHSGWKVSNSSRDIVESHPAVASETLRIFLCSQVTRAATASAETWLESMCMQIFSIVISHVCSKCRT